MSSLTTSLDHLDSARQRWSRIGEHWPQGPVGQRATTPVGLGDYLVLVRELEAVADPEGVHRQLRRLHYSRHVRWPQGRRRGVRLDALIAGDAREVPLVWASGSPGVGRATLDRLSAAGYLNPATSPQVPVDLGAVFTATDAAFSGGSDLGFIATRSTGVPTEGIATWVGDLAAWFLTCYGRGQRAAHSGQPWSKDDAVGQLADARRAEAPLEVMLGSIDGQILANYYEAAVSGSYDSAPKAADTLDRYYGAVIPTDAHPHVSQRFATFVQRAAPPIPHDNSGGHLVLASTATDAIRRHVADLAAFLLYQGRRIRDFGIAVSADPAPPGPLAAVTEEIDAQAATIGEIAVAFSDLLRTGLAGSAPLTPWPRAI
jgi:hypothetical protein